MPIYYIIGKRKPKKTLMGLNWYRNANSFLLGDIKKWYTDLIVGELSGTPKMRGEVKVHYTVHLANKQGDGNNVGAVMSKFGLDGFKAAGIFADDTASIVVREVFDYKIDKNDPRCDVIISEIQSVEF